MDILEIVKFSDSLKKEADLIIQVALIKELFSSLGRVTFVGSYALNLLFRRDIDLFVQNDICSIEKAKDITKQIVDKSIFQTVGFANWTELKAPNNLKGFYWKLEFYHQDNKWKFDIWYTNESEIITINKTKILLKKLKEHPDARKKILMLKQELYNGDSYNNGMNGFRIYEKVLGKIT